MFCLVAVVMDVLVVVHVLVVVDVLASVLVFLCVCVLVSLFMLVCIVMFMYVVVPPSLPLLSLQVPGQELSLHQGEQQQGEKEEPGQGSLGREEERRPGHSHPATGCMLTSRPEVGEEKWETALSSCCTSKVTKCQGSKGLA